MVDLLDAAFPNSSSTCRCPRFPSRGADVPLASACRLRSNCSRASTWAVMSVMKVMSSPPARLVAKTAHRQINQIRWPSAWMYCLVIRKDSMRPAKRSATFSRSLQVLRRGQFLPGLLFRVSGVVAEEPHSRLVNLPTADRQGRPRHMATAALIHRATVEVVGPGLEPAGLLRPAVPRPPGRRPHAARQVNPILAAISVVEGFGVRVDPVDEAIRREHPVALS